MKWFPILILPLAAYFFYAVPARAEVEKDNFLVESLNPGTDHVSYDFRHHVATGTNGVWLRYIYKSAPYPPLTLTAEKVTANWDTGDVDAEGRVRLETGEALWAGERIHYNFKTRQLRTEQFRAGRSPVFAGGNNLTGDISNRVFTAENGMATTDDWFDPAYEVRAARIKIIPGQSVEMWNAVMYAQNVPVFYFPYYRRNFGPRANNWLIMPGYNSRFGGYALGTYRWFWGEDFDGRIHLDYRLKRGIGVGPDVSGRLGQWGDFNLQYYYTHDRRPNFNTNGFPQFGNIPENRQRLKFDWQATPATNLNLKALVNYQSDPLMTHDFYPGEYGRNPQPGTFVEINKYWNNWSLDALTTPRVNSFFDQTERLPDVKLTGYRQQVLDSPVYYDSENSLGWYRQFRTDTNNLYQQLTGATPNAAARADTFHQFTLPWTFFNWLNVTPRAGGRLTYYSRQDAAGTQPDDAAWRAVFNTGVEVSFKASRLWTDATNAALQINGLRHIIEPSINYAFIPDPSIAPGELPQFDGERPSLLLLPILFPDNNNIDAIDAQNVIRFGLRNTLQTKRDGRLEDLLSWNLVLDWRLDPKDGRRNLDDLYSALLFRPRNWLTLESQTRNDLNNGHLNLAFEQATFSFDDRWSWGLGYWYVRGGQWGNGAWDENNFLTSTLFYRLNNNWGARMTDNYNIVTGRLQEQFYTLYRDFRTWTAGLTFRVVDDLYRSRDYTIAFSLSFKAAPTFRVGDDVANRYRLLGQ